MPFSKLEDPSLYFIPISTYLNQYHYTKVNSSFYLFTLRGIVTVSELFTPYILYDIDGDGTNFYLHQTHYWYALPTKKESPVS